MNRRMDSETEIITCLILFIAALLIGTLFGYIVIGMTPTPHFTP